MVKKSKEAHTAPTKYGMGDYYGSGVKNPAGKPRDVMGDNYKKVTKYGKPPKALA